MVVNSLGSFGLIDTRLGAEEHATQKCQQMLTKETPSKSLFFLAKGPMITGIVVREKTFRQNQF